MSAPLTIEGPDGIRQPREEEFPLSMGGPDAAIQLPGIDDSEALAWLGLSEGRLFVQPGTAAGTTVTCNGVPVTTSQWLHPGDVIRIGPTDVMIRQGVDGFCLSMNARSQDNTTEPPVLMPSPAGQAPEEERAAVSIQPIAFHPRAAPPSRGGHRRIRPAMALTWALLLVLGVAAWLLFSLKPVEVRIDPVPDRLWFQGAGLFGWKVGGYHLLRQGSYTLLAEKAGYRRLEVQVEVTGEDHQSLRFALQKLPGLLAIDTGPVQGASVLVDGEEKGVTPLDPVELAPGDHQVRIEARRYEVFETAVSIAGGGSRQELQAELVPRWAAVTVRSTPAGAAVRVDGKMVGTTPVTVDLLEGAHAVALHLAGHKPRSETIRVAARRPMEIGPLNLDLVDAHLKVQSAPGGATVTLDGQYRGETPMDLPLAAGRTHTIRVSKAGHETATRTVNLDSGQSQEMAVTLIPQEGVVEIAAQPVDATLYVDGEPRGPAHQSLHLPAVPHQIEIRKEGFLPYRTTLTPRPGFPQTLRPVLRTAKAQAMASLSRTLRSAEGHDLVLIEGGRFQMGASRREPGRRANETLHQVELTRPFYLSTMEVTNRQFRRFKPDHLSGQIGSFNLETDHHPVVRVTWEEAALYCNWLSAEESLPPVYVKQGGRVLLARPVGTGYRLPTEAEWAWAARFAGRTQPLKYPWGTAMPVPAGGGNYADESVGDLLSSSLDGYNDSFPVTAPVDSFRPNVLGLYNMGGNVAEWVQDIYTIYSSAAGGVQRDPLGPEDGDLHTIRGSSWMDSSITPLRLSYRRYGSKTLSDVGFRIARYAR
ncbi:MAG: PEGA domain-containing protein [Acidobacteriota bacterium]